MTPGARLAAAIEVFAAIESERRPAADALKSWGTAHRFAGSSDRAAIAGLVYDALRRRSSSAWLMGADTPRAILLGMLKRERGLDTETVARLVDGSRFAAEALSEDALQQLIKDAIAVSGAQSMKDMGKLMNELRPKVQGRADMGQVSQKVKAILG